MTLPASSTAPSTTFTRTTPPTSSTTVRPNSSEACIPCITNIANTSSVGDPSEPNENWYGYPTCFTVWGGDEFPNGENPATGSLFIPAPNATFSDATCKEQVVGPRLSFQAHSAPIDAKFDRQAENLFVSLHGSWNRDVPTGYKVVSVPFGAGEPVAPADSKDGYDDILWDPQEECDSAKCFRPSGLAWDRQFTHLFVSSDNNKEGELYILHKTS